MPGFGSHADKELAIAWYKAGCLFPFMRNHANAGTARQEPWVFGPEALQTIRHHVRLRYKLLPYMYQLWNDQEQNGTAVMRPLFHDYANTDAMELDRIDDQFLIGPAILQAPLVQQGQQQRTVALPGTARWMDVNTGAFIASGGNIHVTSNSESTPIYLKEGSLVPMQVGVRTTAANDLADIELHVILGVGCTDNATLDYVADDGLSYGYQRGERNVYRLTASRAGDVLTLDVSALQTGWKALRLRVVGYDGASSVQLCVGDTRTTFALTPFEWHFSGGMLAAAASAPIDL